MLLTVGRIGRAHGVRGEVTVEVRTDSPDARFQLGAELLTDPENRGPLKIASIRWNNGTLLLSFAGRENRNAVENLRNTILLADVDVTEAREEDEFHITQIVGCVAIDDGGTEVGRVVDVLALPAADTLVIERGGKEILIPFVKHHVPIVDIENQKIELANLEGLI